MAHLTKRTRKEATLDREQFKKLMTIKGVGGAGLYETMGPQWQHIYWSPAKRPYVVRNGMTFKEVMAIVNKKDEPDQGEQNHG